ncbi:MAG: thiamine-phosphate kinase [Rhizomicrobium sp.]
MTSSSSDFSAPAKRGKGTGDAGGGGEFKLIARHFAPLAKARGAFGLADDAATLAPPRGHEIVVTTDALIAGVHFLTGDPPGDIARKALRVNLSDLAAKGAEPLGYLLALALPRTVRDAWLREFARGLAKDQKAFRVALLGGDTTATPGPLTIAITAIGSVPRGRMIRRKGARPGDLVFVSGTIGDAGAGLALLRRKRKSPTRPIARYRLPTPRLALGLALRGIATAALDVSDGLVADLGHIAEVSKVRIAIDAARIPGGHDPVAAATAGDDYEIAFTAPNRAAVVRAAKRARVRVTEVGRVERGRGCVLLDKSGEPIALTRAGYSHF